MDEQSRLPNVFLALHGALAAAPGGDNEFVNGVAFRRRDGYANPIFVKHDGSLRLEYQKVHESQRYRRPAAQCRHRRGLDLVVVAAPVWRQKFNPVFSRVLILGRFPGTLLMRDFSKLRIDAF